MQTNKRSDKHLTLYHILPSERACLLVEGLLATGQVVPRSMVLIATADAVNWDDEVMLVRPLRVWVDHIISMLCAGGYVRRIHSQAQLSYQATLRWKHVDEVLQTLRHPTGRKPIEKGKTYRRNGNDPSDVVINMREWQEARSVIDARPRRSRKMAS
ncbi:hypothetical protein VWT76_15640 [Xanthomonas citri pv. citri]|uniref:hypothetical protein n=1 Tax=Xanthomonas TaxID=338 RepID=UPI000952AA0D|nr:MULTISPECIES: hypothetical protein [Xanthomonas]MBD5034929.1 hypothetical protein [Xanthomonas citri pv. citri]MBD5054787.1 hypothetical protein [Xanthomonas citri pv. citri]MCC8630207.1 hypothetical protein [Xanthomonas vesicatoria]OLR69837.1 hypothetical protein BI311_24325 [Xanthomonas citri pv. citri]